MLVLVFCLVVLPAIYADKKPSGISQFWTDDFKAFEQIYGRTSDKELYGATLPPTISFDYDRAKQIKSQASEKKERYFTNSQGVTDLDANPYGAYVLDDKYAKLFAKNLYTEKKKPSSALQLISFSDVKPISESNDPETYNYLKHLEKMSKQKSEAANKGRKVIKYSPVGSDPEANDAYKSIQDILDAHEANKGNGSNEGEEDQIRSKGKKSKGVTDGKDLSYAFSRNRNKVRQINGNSLKSRCTSGRCRKHAHSPVVVGSRPYIRKIKRYRYTRR